MSISNGLNPTTFCIGLVEVGSKTCTNASSNYEITRICELTGFTLELTGFTKCWRSFVLTKDLANVGPYESLYSPPNNDLNTRGMVTVQTGMNDVNR